MTQKQLIEHLRDEVKRVKIQRNDYEQRWLMAVRDMEELKKIYDLPSYAQITKEQLKKLKNK